jgi:hypothetical protein
MSCRRSKRTFRSFEKKSAVAPVVATMMLIIVAITAVGTFAYFLSGLQMQAQKTEDKFQAVQNENLQVSFAQFYPVDWAAPNITAIFLSVRNLNIEASGLIGLAVNGNLTSLMNSSVAIINGVQLNSSVPIDVPARESISVNISGYQIPRTSAISISLFTASDNTFSFSVGPPQASFLISNSNSNYSTLDASGSTPANGILSYNWEISPFPGSFVSESGETVQYFSNMIPAAVTLVVVNSYGLISSETQGLFPSSLIPSGNDSQFVLPYLSQLEKIREVLMTPFTPGSYGYDPTTGLVCGGNIEASPAIGVQSGYNDVCVLTDNNIEGGNALDYFNGASSVLSGLTAFSTFNQGYFDTAIVHNNVSYYYLSSNVYNTTRSYLSQPFYGIGGCPSPFSPVLYPSSFTPLYDRREGEYGFIGPYANILDTPGVHLGGIGQSCGTEGQVWYVENGGTVITNPLIVAEMPGTPIGPNNDLEELSFYIDEAYMQYIAGNAPAYLWQTAYKNAMSQFPFEAPRQALHFIQVTLATNAWNLTDITYDGITPFQMLEIAIQQVFTPANQVGPMAVLGDVGRDGGLYQSWGAQGSSNTPEANMQAMIAFDPQMPTWFTLASCVSALLCT